MTPGKQLIRNPAAFMAELDFPVINENVLPPLCRSETQLLKAALLPALSCHHSLGLRMIPCHPSSLSWEMTVLHE